MCMCGHTCVQVRAAQRMPSGVFSLYPLYFLRQDLLQNRRLALDDLSSPSTCLPGVSHLHPQSSGIKVGPLCSCPAFDVVAGI